MDDTSRRVAAAYDRMADLYLSRYGHSAVRQKWFERLAGRLPPDGGTVLDLGCGAGVPVCRDLARLGHAVVGVDASTEQVARARAAVPQATFMQADMASVAFEAERFDAVGAFYAVTHIPAAQQGPLFGRIARWLKPGGVFVASLGTGPGGDWTGEWLGEPMVFSHNQEAVSLALLAEAGLRVERAEVEPQDNEDTRFLWVVAAKPS